MDAMRDGGARSINNSSVQTVNDMIRRGGVAVGGAAIACPVQRSKTKAAPTRRFIQRFTFRPA